MRALALWAIGLVICLGCAEEFQGRPPLTDGLHYPMTTAIDEASGRLFVINSNFDLAYQAASLVTFDLETHKYLEGGATFGAFPGDFILVDSPDGSDRFGFLTVRGDNSLTWFKVSGDGDELTFSCNDGDGDAGTCTGEFVISETDVYLDDSDEVATLGSDPFGIGVLPGTDTRPVRLVLGAMRGGQMSLLELDEGGQPTLVDQVNLASGLHTVAVDPATEVIYLTNKTYPLLYRYVVDEASGAPQFAKRTSINLPSPYSSVQYSRGIAFAHGGQDILVTYRTPAALLILNGADATPEYDQVVLQSVPLGSKPGNIAVADSGPDGRSIAYVPCYGDDTLWAVDIDSGTPVAVIPVGSGPYDVKAVFSDHYKRAYVTNFLDHTVSVIDIDPASPFYHTHLAEVH